MAASRSPLFMRARARTKAFQGKGCETAPVPTQRSIGRSPNNVSLISTGSDGGTGCSCCAPANNDPKTLMYSSIDQCANGENFLQVLQPYNMHSCVDKEDVAGEAAPQRAGKKNGGIGDFCRVGIAPQRRPVGDRAEHHRE